MVLYVESDSRPSTPASGARSAEALILEIYLIIIINLNEPAFHTA